MPLYRHLFYFLILTPILPVMADEVYEVTALRPVEALEAVGNTETIIPQQDIENFQEMFLKESLPYAPSIQLNSSGPVGRDVDFSMRGARSSQNLVLVDGIYVNNPASGGGVDLSNFLNADIEKIEVLPGPQALVYGPGALGGVIQLIPKKGHGKPSLKATGEGGSFKTRYGTLTAQGEKGPLQFSATLAGFGRGPASFINPLHGNPQSDRYRNGTLSSRVGYALQDNWEIEGIVRYVEAKVQFDEPQRFPDKNIFLPIRANNFTDTKTFLSSLENRWGGERVDHSLKLSYPRFEQATKMPNFHSKTIGSHPLLAYISEIKINSKNTLLPGLDLGQEQAEETKKHTRRHGGIFLINTYKPFESTALKAGIRGDRYESLGGKLTFNVGVVHAVFSSTAVRASYGTNFKPPTLSDLFQQNLLWQIPNPNLKPEKSQSVDAGLDQTFWEKKGKLSLTAFFTQIDKITLSKLLINDKWQRYNGGRRVTQGIEIYLGFKPIKDFQIKTSFTINHARDYPGKVISPLIPLFKGAGEIYWQTTKSLSLFMQAYGVSSRKDSASTPKKTLAPYGLIHVGGAYKIIQHLALFGRVENLTNTHYEEVFGYGARGRAFYLGLEATT
ncbi:TonB-dependent receptor [Kamptonema cortianum]|nr:TonB-dependent receptor [Geitlerinema splendidum]MDK3155634.1 TonB-dependent receptor [Kamptonema cortianum]